MEKIDFRRPSDSLLTHLFARSISVYITPLLAKTIVTPLQVTIIGLIVGLCAAWAGSNQSWLYCLSAAVLMEISHILDCVDGELARLTGRGSPFAASMDPISDRIKDMAVLYAACLQSIQLGVFSLSEHGVFSITLLALGLWFLYIYIVDAFINPARKKKDSEDKIERPRIYLGLYDLFIYGSILFWIFHIFGYFIFYILIISSIGILLQLIQLKANLS